MFAHTCLFICNNLKHKSYQFTFNTNIELTCLYFSIISSMMQHFMLQLLSIIKYIKIEAISEEQNFAKLVLLCLQLPVLFA